MPWSTNGTFIWPTDDDKVIHAQGHHIAIDVSADTAQFCGKSTAELCEWIVGCLNAAEAGAGASSGQDSAK
jgi:hypothetical protein